MTEKNRKSLKLTGSRPGVIYDSLKKHKASVENCLPLQSILSALKIPTYELVKFLVPFLKPLTTNKFNIKDSIHFAEEIVDQQSDFLMGSLDVDSQFTNIALEETIEICTNEPFKESETIEGLSRFDFQVLLSQATKDLHFTFDRTLYKHINGVVMVLP